MGLRRREKKLCECSSSHNTRRTPSNQASKPHWDTWHSSVTGECDVKYAQMQLEGGVVKTLSHYRSHRGPFSPSITCLVPCLWNVWTVSLLEYTQLSMKVCSTLCCHFRSVERLISWHVAPVQTNSMKTKWEWSEYNNVILEHIDYSAPLHAWLHCVLISFPYKHTLTHPFFFLPIVPYTHSHGNMSDTDADVNLFSEDRSKYALTNTYKAGLFCTCSKATVGFRYCFVNLTLFCVLEPIQMHSHRTAKTQVWNHAYQTFVTRGRAQKLFICKKTKDKTKLQHSMHKA